MAKTSLIERAAAGYFKLATFCPRSFTWRDGKTAYPTEDNAIAAASKPGQYRISRVDASGRHDLTPFSV